MIIIDFRKNKCGQTGQKFNHRRPKLPSLDPPKILNLNNSDLKSQAHKEIRSIFFPLPYEDGSRAVIGVK